jgi:hypothetical protein
VPSKSVQECRKGRVGHYAGVFRLNAPRGFPAWWRCCLVLRASRCPKKEGQTLLAKR